MNKYEAMIIFQDNLKETDWDGAVDAVRAEIERWRNHFADLDAQAEALADELHFGHAGIPLHAEEKIVEFRRGEMPFFYNAAHKIRVIRRGDDVAQPAFASGKARRHIGIHLASASKQNDGAVSNPHPVHSLTSPRRLMTRSMPAFLMSREHMTHGSGLDIALPNPSKPER